MTTHPNPQSVTEKVSCEICLKEIPLSEAKRFEAEDYVAELLRTRLLCDMEAAQRRKQAA